MNRLPYTLATIKEVLRIYPPPDCFRDGRPDFTLTDRRGRECPTKDSHVWILNVGMHNDPVVFLNAEDFNPERWLVEPDHPLHPVKGSWRPFEWGPRSCVRQTLALPELKVVLVMTLKVFEFIPAYGDWDIAHLKKGLEHVDGNRAYQAQLGGGGAHPADGYPVIVRLR